MSIINKFYQGQSLTIGVLIAEGYNMLNLESSAIIIGETKKNTSVIDRMLRVELTSEDTQLFISPKNVTLIIDDALFGKREYLLGTFSFVKTQGQTFDTSVDLGYTVIFNITIAETTITVVGVVYDVMKGDSAFRLWQLEAGNLDKTIDDYFAYLRQPALDAAIIANTATTACTIATDAMLSNLISLEIDVDMNLTFTTPTIYTGLTFDLVEGNLIAII